jgi:hypothetical protein
MHEIVTEVVLEASAERVWQVVTNLDAYSGWNPVLRRVRGRLAIGQRLTVVRIGAHGREIVERPTVVRYRPVRELRWRTRLALPWLLDTERVFRVESLGPVRTRFLHWQSRSGLLSLLLLGVSQATTREHFEVMNLALKAHVEHGARSFGGTSPQSTSQMDGAHEGTDDRGHHPLVAPTWPVESMGAPPQSH